MNETFRGGPGRRPGGRIVAAESERARRKPTFCAVAGLTALLAGVWAGPAGAEGTNALLGLAHLRLTEGAAVGVLSAPPQAPAQGVSIQVSATVSGSGASPPPASSPALEEDAQATGTDSLALGAQAQASGERSVAAGAGAQASGVNAMALGAGAMAGVSNSVALGAGSVADRPNTVSVGAPGQERQITHVADGTQDTDAVNVRQLRNTAGELGAGLTELRNDLRTVERNANAGAASAMAVAGLPQPYAPGRSMAAAAASHYLGQSAIALGVSTISENGRWVYKFAGNVNSQGKLGAVIGAGFQW